MTQKVCIVGGGASGVALLWCLAKAQQQNTGNFEITLVHDDLVYVNGQPQPGIPSLGGHSRTVPVTVNGTEYWIDLGVQMIAPVMYPNLRGAHELADAATFEALLKAQPGLMLSLQTLLNSDTGLFKDLSTFETYFLDP